ncbi:MAG: hypothetical protein QW478_06690 [Candidatus Micrarchaeaceae archaeon]
MRAGSKKDIAYIKEYILNDINKNVAKSDTIKYLHFNKHYSLPTLYKYYKIVSEENDKSQKTKNKLEEITNLLNDTNVVLND